MNQVSLGFVYLGFYLIVIGFSEVLVGHFAQHFSPAAILFSGALITSLIYLPRALAEGLPSINSIYLRRFLTLNIFAGGAWLGMFVSLKYLEPALASMISSAAVPVATVFLSRRLRPQHPLLSSEISSSVGLGVLLIISILASTSGQSALGAISFSDLLIGTSAGLFSGISSVGLIFAHKYLSEAQWSVSQLLAQRFWLLIILCGFWLVRFDLQGAHIALNQWPQLLLLGFITTTVPLTFALKANERCEPIHMSLALGAIPVVTWFFETFDPRLEFSVWSLLITLASTLLLSWAIWDRHQNEKRSKRFCVIVDPYSSGATLAAEVKALGYQIIHVQSQKVLPYYLNFDPANFAQHFVYDNNLETLTEQIKAFSPKAVIAGSEIGVELADALSAALKMPSSNGLKLSAARRNKSLMAEAITRAGVPAAKFVSAKSFEEMKHWMQSQGLSYPLVVKPEKSGATDGVVVCYNDQMAEQAFEENLGKVNLLGEFNSRMMVMEYLQGTEYVVNHVSWEGKHYLSEIFEYEKTEIDGKKLYVSDRFVPPNSLLAQELVAYARQVLHALDIKYGPSHMEVILTPKGPRLVEVGARLDGLAHPVYKECHGVDAAQLTAAAYLDPLRFGKLLRVRKRALTRNKFARFIHFRACRDGIMETLNHETLAKSLRSLKTYYAHQIKLKDGQFKKTVNYVTSPAMVVLMGQSEADVEYDRNLVHALESKYFS